MVHRNCDINVGLSIKQEGIRQYTSWMIQQYGRTGTIRMNNTCRDSYLLPGSLVVR